MELIKIDEEIVVNVLSRRDEIENHLYTRQKDLLEANQTLEKDIYNKLPKTSMIIGEDVNVDGKPFKDLSLHIQEEFYRQRTMIQEEIIYIQKQQAIIRRIHICFAALPFNLREVIEKLYIQGQKWDALELSRSCISDRKQRAMEQILEWYHSEATDLELIYKGQGLRSETLTSRKNSGLKRTKTD